MAEWRWRYAVDTCGAKDDRPLETEIDIRKSSNQPLEMELELNFDGTWNLRAKRWTMGTMNTFGLGHDVVDVAAFAEQLGQPGSHMRALFSVREVRQAAGRAPPKNGSGRTAHGKKTMAKLSIWPPSGPAKRRSLKRGVIFWGVRRSRSRWIIFRGARLRFSMIRAVCRMCR